MRLQFTPEKKAQGPMEYLLIIGGLVLVAVVVIVLLLGMTGDVADTAPGLSASGSDITRGLRYSGTGESPPEGGEVTPPGTVPPGTEPPKGAEEICDNGIDDDSDDKVDCFDDSCACVLTLESPAPGDIISNPPADSFAFRWTEISGAKEYLLEYAATNPLSKREIRMSERTQETSFEVGSDAFKEFPDGTINWTVAALDGSGKELVSSPSEFHKFYGKGGIAFPSNRRTYFSLGTWFQGTSLPHAAEYGIGMQRMQANWKTWEVLESAGNGEAYFEVTDLIIELAERNGVAIMISPYSTGKGGVEWDESCDLKDKQSYLDFLGGLLDRYKGRIEFWEIWNEPNLVDGGEGEFWCTNRSSQKVAMEGYARLLGDAYNLVKSKCPDCVVLNGGWVWNVGGAGDAVKIFLDAGGAESFDMMAFHPYPKDDGINDPEIADDPLEGDYFYLKGGEICDIMRPYYLGKEMPSVFANEFGFSSHAVGDEMQAVYDLTAAAELLRNNSADCTVVGVSLFGYNSGGFNSGDPANYEYWRAMSFVEGRPICDPDVEGEEFCDAKYAEYGGSNLFIIYGEKPVFRAYAEMARRLQGCTFMQRTDAGDSFEYVFNCGTMVRKKNCSTLEGCISFR